MGGWVFFAIFIIIAVVSALSHVLKNQQQAEPPQRRGQQRPQRKAQGVRVSSDAEQDRFLAEIERLRKKAASGPKPVPTVKPVKPKKPQPAKSFTPRLEELPVATIASASHGRASDRPSITITPPSNVQSIAEVATIHTILDVVKPADAGGGTAAKMLGIGKARRSAPAAAVTPFAKQMTEMLQSKDALPIAVMMQEILGPPKCRRA